LCFGHACKLGLEGIVSKRLGLALPLRPLAALGQEQESGSTRSEAGSGRRLGPLKRRRLLDVLLAIIAVVSVAVVLLLHEDPFARIAVCNHIGFCPTFAHAKAFYKMFYDLGVGALVTLAFYFLVVRLPDYQRRQRLKRSLELHYRAFRLNCIELMLLVADGELGSVKPEALLDPEKFREYFKQRVMPDKERWHEFFNNLDKFYLGQLQTLMEQFRDELIFILNNTGRIRWVHSRQFRCARRRRGRWPDRRTAFKSGHCGAGRVRHRCARLCLVERGWAAAVRAAIGGDRAEKRAARSSAAGDRAATGRARRAEERRQGAHGNAGSGGAYHRGDDGGRGGLATPCSAPVLVLEPGDVGLGNRKATAIRRRRAAAPTPLTKIGQMIRPAVFKGDAQR